MNSNKPTFLIVLLIISSLAMSQEIDNKVGTSGFQFLKIGIGPRDVALAGTSFPTTEGPISMYWNPAGICSDQKLNVSFFYNSWIATIDHSFIGLTTPFSLNDYIGVSVNFISMQLLQAVVAPVQTVRG